MSQENLEQFLEMFRKAFEQLAQEIISFMPKIFITIIVFVIAFVVIRLLNPPLKKLLKFTKLDEMFKRFTSISLPFSLDSLIIALADLGIFLIALFVIANLFLGPEQMKLISETIAYLARLVSIIAIIFVALTTFEIVIERIGMETKLRGYMLFIVLLLFLTMLVDITALTEPAKKALMEGLSIGIGLSVGAFAVWFFFHEHLDRIFKKRHSS
mgnify:CR=1 FL=1